MTETQAAEELFEAIQADKGENTAPPPAAPAEESNPPEPATEVTPEGESQEQPSPPDAEDSFTKLDPNSLPEELRPYYQSMQQDYTRKTQSLAEQRKQLEGIDDLEAARVGYELLQSLGTSEGVVQFHGLLSQQLQQMGLSPAEADVVATQQVQQAQQAPPAPSFEDDPEAALKYEIEQARSEVAQLREQMQADQVAAQQEAEYYQLAGEIARQDALLREANPHYDDDDMNAVYEMAAFYGGNLVQAQQRYESAVSNRIARLLNSKQQAASETGVQAVGTPSHADAQPRFESLEGAHLAAMEHLRQIEAQG